MYNVKGLIGTAFGIALLKVIGISSAFSAGPAYYITPVKIYNCTNCQFDRDTFQLSCNSQPRSFFVYTGVVTHCTNQGCDYSHLKKNVVPKTVRSISSSYAVNIAGQSVVWNELILSEPEGYELSRQPTQSGIYGRGIPSSIIVIQEKHGQYPWGFGTSGLIFPKLGTVTTNCTIEKTA